MDLNIIQKIFPPLLLQVSSSDINNLQNLQNLPKYDQEGLWSITLPQEADYISNLIKLEINAGSTIFDATAGLGGNTISFAKHFKKVVSIELCKSRFEILSNNIQSYKLTNVTLINGDCLDYLNGDYQGYFFDPPWGGPDYKYNVETKIKIGKYSLEEVVSKIKLINEKPIFIKLPFNYNLAEFNKYNYKIDKIKNYQMITIYAD
jgi:16S rRNA G966 N2-methylase RsmD